MKKKVEQIVKVLNKTEGRDRICKMIQYGARLLAWYFQKFSQLDKATQFNNLFMAMREARKIFRLAKSLNEIQYIIEMIKENSENLNEIIRALKIYTRIWYALFWIFDNLCILSQVQIIKKNPKVLNQIAMTFWTIGIIIVNQFTLYQFELEIKLLLQQYLISSTLLIQLRHLEIQLEIYFQ